MRERAAVILIHDKEVLLIKREKMSDTYWVIPGGGVQDGESTIEAAVREIHEELMLALEKTQLEFFYRFCDNERLETYYLAYISKQQFTICGEEKKRSDENNLYIPTWMPIDELTLLDVRPWQMKEKLMMEKSRICNENFV